MSIRRILALALGGSLLVAGLGGPAEGAKKKAKPKPHTLYLHGAEMLGELEEPYPPMDTAEPSGGDMKSWGILGYAVGPNNECAGNALWPVWVGNVAGKIKGDMTFTFSTIGHPGPVEVRVWPDLSSQLCNFMSDLQYPEPAGSVIVDIPAGTGQVEAVIKSVNFKAAAFLMIQVSPEVNPLVGPMVSRILYDSSEAASNLTFKCTPNPGKKACA